MGPFSLLRAVRRANVRAEQRRRDERRARARNRRTMLHAPWVMLVFCLVGLPFFALDGATGGWLPLAFWCAGWCGAAALFWSLARASPDEDEEGAKRAAPPRGCLATIAVTVLAVVVASASVAALVAGAATALGIGPFETGAVAERRTPPRPPPPAPRLAPQQPAPAAVAPPAPLPPPPATAPPAAPAVRIDKRTIRRDTSGAYIWTDERGAVHVTDERAVPKELLERLPRR